MRHFGTANARCLSSGVSASSGMKAGEAAREAAEREAARKREEATRLAKLTEQDRKPQDDTCSRDDEKLARLRGSLAQGWVREDLKRLQNTACDRVQSEVVALLDQLAAAEAAQPRVATEPLSANTPELVLSTQRELRRLGCFDGEEDGRLGDATTAAIRRYLSEKGRPSKDIEVTDILIAELNDESTRVCPVTCAHGEHAEGDRCVAGANRRRRGQPRVNATRKTSGEPGRQCQARAGQAGRTEVRVTNGHHARPRARHIAPDDPR
jgi:hypothetical protein